MMYSGWMGWKSLGGVRFGAPYGAYNFLDSRQLWSIFSSCRVLGVSAWVGNGQLLLVVWFGLGLVQVNMSNYGQFATVAGNWGYQRGWASGNWRKQEV